MTYEARCSPTLLFRVRTQRNGSSTKSCSHQDTPVHREMPHKSTHCSRYQNLVTCVFPAWVVRGTSRDPHHAPPGQVGDFRWGEAGCARHATCTELLRTLSGHCQNGRLVRVCPDETRRWRGRSVIVRGITNATPFLGSPRLRGRRLRSMKCQTRRFSDFFPPVLTGNPRLLPPFRSQPPAQTVMLARSTEDTARQEN